MSGVLLELGNFIITPLLRWIFLFLSVVISILQYLNEPQRFSSVKSILGISYKWYLYGFAILTCVTTTLTIIGLWGSIPFTDKLPDYWYIYFLVLYLAIITQITLDSKEYKNDGTFNPPPSYMFPHEYRIIVSYIGLVIDTIVMIQIFIYLGIADITKKTVLNHYVLERFGGWYEGNKLDFIFEWFGIIDVFVKVYILFLQINFQACQYNLPSSWNA